MWDKRWEIAEVRAHVHQSVVAYQASPIHTCSVYLCMLESTLRGYVPIDTPELDILNYSVLLSILHGASISNGQSVLALLELGWDVYQRVGFDLFSFTGRLHAYHLI